MTDDSEHLRPPQLGWWRPYSQASTLLSGANHIAAKLPYEDCFTWLGASSTTEEARLTFSDLWHGAEAIAHAFIFHWNQLPGHRVLLCYIEEDAFFLAFLACLRAGLVAVPTYAPARQRS